GTIVHLNSDTYIRYPRNFGLFERKVELKGEGYFSVAKELSRPFVVNLHGVDIKVAGTKFNVKAYASDTNVCVLLDEGKVYLEDPQNKHYVLLPGETAEFNRSTRVCQISRPKDTSPITAWRSNSFNFYRISLREILKTFERQYGAYFKISDSTLLKDKFTFSTNKIPLNDILKDLQEVSYVRFVDCGDKKYIVQSVDQRDNSRSK
ncbi:MAG: DUF4974 domain-containing protein, partial [Methanobacterium sp.]|nr:DUF4974 domain-containing protein [Methanobacterium sp.]